MPADNPPRSIDEQFARFQSECAANHNSLLNYATTVNQLLKEMNDQNHETNTLIGSTFDRLALLVGNSADAIVRHENLLARHETYIKEISEKVNAISNLIASAASRP